MERKGEPEDRIGGPQHATDEQLVVASLLGAFSAFDELARRYRSALVLTALPIVGCRSRAEDVAQDALILAFRHLPRLSEPAAFPGWMRAIARNRALRVARESSRFDSHDPDTLGRYADVGDDPSDALTRRAATQNLLEALQALPEELREPLYLRAFEDWSVARIAAYLSVPDATVRGRLFRARALLRRTVGDDI